MVKEVHPKPLTCDLVWRTSRFPLEVNGREKERKPAPARLDMWQRDPTARRHPGSALDAMAFKTFADLQVMVSCHRGYAATVGAISRK